MALDLESLLAPIDGEDPAGPDLSYDPARAELEQVFDRPVSIDVTGAAAAETEVDWRPIVRAIEAQAARTRDIWLPVYLCRAGARSGDLAVVEDGALYLAGLVEQRWDDMHPKLEDYGFQGRKGPCESLTRFAEFVGPLQRAPLLRHPRLGRFSGADFERFRLGAEAEDGYGLFRAALQDTPDEALVAVADQLERIVQAFKTVDRVLMDRADGDSGPNFQLTYDALNGARRAVLSFTTAPAAPAEALADVGGDNAVAAATSGGGLAVPGRMESREDVIRALDAIGDYYRRKEPASPVPLVLQRAREWVTADFLTVLEDIAPGSLDEVRRILVSQRKKDEAGSGW